MQSLTIAFCCYKEHKLTIDELDTVRKRISSVNVEIQDKDKVVLQLQTKVAVLNQDLESKGEVFIFESRFNAVKNFPIN